LPIILKSNIELIDSNHSNIQSINLENSPNKSEFQENENIDSELKFKKQDSVKSQYSEEINTEIEIYRENHFKEMKEEIEKVKQSHMTEIQNFESNF